MHPLCTNVHTHTLTLHTHTSLTTHTHTTHTHTCTHVIHTTHTHTYATTHTHSHAHRSIFVLDSSWMECVCSGLDGLTWRHWTGKLGWCMMKNKLRLAVTPSPLFLNIHCGCGNVAEQKLYPWVLLRLLVGSIIVKFVQLFWAKNTNHTSQSEQSLKPSATWLAHYTSQSENRIQNLLQFDWLHPIPANQIMQFN